MKYNYFKYLHLALLANTPVQAKPLLHNLKQAARGIRLYLNSDKTEFICFNQDGATSNPGRDCLDFTLC